MFRRTIRFISIASISIAAAACDGEGDLRSIDKTSALATTRSHLRTHLVEGARASAFLNDSKLLGGMASGTCEGDAGGTTCETKVIADADVEKGVDELADRVFVEANVEVEESNRIVLLLGPNVVCVDDQGRTDADCVKVLQEVPIRLELTSREENQLDVGVLVGEDRLNPLDISLSDTELSAEIDLAATKASVELIAAVTGEDAELPDTMTGRVGFALEKLGAEAFKASFSVLEDTDIGDGQGDARTAIHADKADPALSLTVDGGEEQVTVAASFAELMLTTPLGDVFDSLDEEDMTHQATGSASARLGALRGALTYEGATDDVTVTGLDTGDGFQVSVDGLPIFGLDLAAEAMRISEENDQALVEVTPSFQADMNLRFENVAGRVDEAIPAWLARDDLSLRLEGSPSASVLLEKDDAPDANPLPVVKRVLKVVSGSLSLTSSSGDHDVTVEAGACLLEAESEVEHQLAQLTAGVCL